MKGFKLTHLWATMLLLAIGNACTVKYSFTGASISPEVRSFTVYYFPNKAQLVNPNLSEALSEALRDKFIRQTNLEMMNDGGDLEFEGHISGYEVRPMAIQSGDVAAQNRLTVTVKVSFTDKVTPENDFESSFSAFAEFPSDQLISDVEEDLMEEIVDQIVEDIFNKSVANW